jgi:hypothetical protein
MGCRRRPVRHQAVVLALAEAVADRVNRRQIDDIEAHRLDLAQAANAVLQGAMPVRHAALRARKELVPGGEAGHRPIDHDRQRGRQFVALAAVGAARHQAAHHAADAEVDRALLLADGQRTLHRVIRPLMRVRAGPGASAAEVFRICQPLEEFAVEVGAGHVLLGDLVRPTTGSARRRLRWCTPSDRSRRR